jgi:hypothetical protein
MELESATRSEAPPADVVECGLCGTRLRHNDEPNLLEIGGDAFMTVARHRCVARVTTIR